MNGTDTRTLYSYIDSLSTEELETLLRAEALSGEAEDPDLTDYILEVIVKREGNMRSGGLPDVKRARQEFDELYRGLETPLYDSGPLEETSSPGTDAGTRSPKPPVRFRTLRRALLVAATLMLVLAVTVVPVFGYPNVIQMVAHLANGTFRFVPDGSAPGNPGNSTIMQPVGSYETLPEALEAYGIQEQVFPKILAEEFEQIALKVEEYPISHRIDFFAQYKNDSQTLVFTVIRHSDPTGWTHEINDDLDFDPYIVNDINHLILYNLDSTTVTWYIGNLECSLSGYFSTSEAESFIDSIYKRS